MPLYLGKNLINITSSNGDTYTLYITENFSPIRLLSYDNYTLQDSNGLYLIPKEEN